MQLHTKAHCIHTFKATRSQRIYGTVLGWQLKLQSVRAPSNGLNNVLTMHNNSLGNSDMDLLHAINQSPLSEQ